jgi:hypothetical protein
MASKFQPRSEGVNVTSDFPPTLHILLKKTYPKNNIVVGDDRAQIRFLEHRLSTDANEVVAVRVERVTDDMLAGCEGKLYHVSMKHKVDLSPELRGRTGVWAADPIVKCSAAINALVKFAATLIPGREKTIKREIVDRIGEDITKKGVPDMAAELCRVSLWLEAIEPGKPLSFLDHHIRVGNSLPLALVSATKPWLLPAFLSTFPADYCLRQKMGDDAGGPEKPTSTRIRRLVGG